MTIKKFFANAVRLGLGRQVHLFVADEDFPQELRRSPRWHRRDEDNSRRYMTATLHDLTGQAMLASAGRIQFRPKIWPDLRPSPESYVYVYVSDGAVSRIELSDQPNPPLFERR